MAKTYTATVGDSTVVIETGKLAGQAGGAVTVRCGDTMLLATATASKEPREGVDFLPLMVDYEERLYAAGKIPGGFFKREGRPSEAAILLCRLTDRSIRPLFPKGLRHDIQVIVTALSADQEHYLDILAIIGASAALTISNVPFAGPVGAVRVGYIDGEFVLNPTAPQMEKSLMDIRVAGTAEAVTMVEAGAQIVEEDLVLEATRRGYEAMQDLIRVQNQMREEVGKPKMEIVPPILSEEVRQAVAEIVGDRFLPTLLEASSKQEREAKVDALWDEVRQQLGEVYEETDIRSAFEEIFKQVVRASILEKKTRVDGRDLRTIRPVHCEVGVLPRVHGSGLFTRGETQVLTISTLGTASDEQILDGLGLEESKRYMHHYNFPPYSTGETRPLRGPRRREIGHGALAERALLPVLPKEEDFPYTIRLVSEVMSSNGSTSMASVCASSLALMDTGVPISEHVAGIAMGLIKEGDRYAILTDIMGMEDHLGDMDFKVAGTAEGITALQMDIKVKGISFEIMREALAQAREARLFILERMKETIAQPRPKLSPYAPRITMLKIDPEKIGKLIGPGGKTIRGIIEQTGVKIDVEDDGTVHIASVDGTASDRAVEMVQRLTEEAQIGKIYTGKVVRVTDFGAFVEILPGQDGLVHISQLADYRVPSVEDVVHVGDEIMVMVIDIDSEGRIKLSRQAVLEGWTPEEARARDKRSARPKPRPDTRKNRRGTPRKISPRRR